MRQRLTIILTFVVIIGLLVLLNTLTYVKQEKTRDSELMPNRSTYHSGPTGTRALHDFMAESGYKVMRWREAPEKLLGATGENVATFVVIGSTQLPFTEEQSRALAQWVARGGCYVRIDREPALDRSLRSDTWTIVSRSANYPTFETDPADPSKMTDSVSPLTPTQPTSLTHNIADVLPSRFAARLTILPTVHNAAVKKEAPSHGVSGPPPEEDDGGIGLPPDEDQEEPPPPPAKEYETKLASVAPVIHIADKNGALLVDYSFGRGHIILLSDPYIVTNVGIRSHDNLQLAINALTTVDGLIAFDEYHQGRGITRNALASYFAGTPVLAIGGQIVLLVLLVLWTNARRFARPLPLPQVDRRSSLEFVASMSELQERSRAYDLAIENIYSRTRRVLARYAGLNYNSSRSEIAARIAARSNIDRHQLETLMRQCEEAINGEKLHWQQAVDLVKRLRELEKRLGLRLRSRDVRQAAEHI
jgi:hypothetical protein